jgi:hypothetical protein
MVAAAADNPGQGELPAAPAITVSQVGVVRGDDFLPDHEVVVRLTHPGDGVSDYVTYTSDHDGHLDAELPSTALVGILQIAASDHRPDPAGQCGRVWSNTCTFKSAAG